MASPQHTPGSDPSPTHLRTLNASFPERGASLDPLQGSCKTGSEAGPRGSYGSHRIFSFSTSIAGVGALDPMEVSLEASAVPTAGEDFPMPQRQREPQRITALQERPCAAVTDGNGGRVFSTADVRGMKSGQRGVARSTGESFPCKRLELGMPQVFPSPQLELGDIGCLHFRQETGEVMEHVSPGDTISWWPIPAGEDHRNLGMENCSSSLHHEGAATGTSKSTDRPPFLGQSRSTTQAVIQEPGRAHMSGQSPALPAEMLSTAERSQKLCPDVYVEDAAPLGIEEGQEGATVLTRCRDAIQLTEPPGRGSEVLTRVRKPWTQGSGNFPCKVCGMRFRSVQALGGHQNGHRDLRNQGGAGKLKSGGKKQQKRRKVGGSMERSKGGRPQETTSRLSAQNDTAKGETRSQITGNVRKETLEPDKIRSTSSRGQLSATLPWFPAATQAVESGVGDAKPFMNVPALSCYPTRGQEESPGESEKCLPSPYQHLVSPGESGAGLPSVHPAISTEFAGQLELIKLSLSPGHRAWPGKEPNKESSYKDLALTPGPIIPSTHIPLPSQDRSLTCKRTAGWHPAVLQPSGWHSDQPEERAVAGETRTSGQQGKRIVDGHGSARFSLKAEMPLQHECFLPVTQGWDQIRLPQEAQRGLAASGILQGGVKIQEMDHVSVERPQGTHTGEARDLRPLKASPCSLGHSGHILQSSAESFETPRLRCQSTGTSMKTGLPILGPSVSCPVHMQGNDAESIEDMGALWVHEHTHPADKQGIKRPLHPSGGDKRDHGKARLWGLDLNLGL